MDESRGDAVRSAEEPRELIDATVKTYFVSLQPAHQAAMVAVVEKTRSEHDVEYVVTQPR